MELHGASLGNRARKVNETNLGLHEELPEVNLNPAKNWPSSWSMKSTPENTRLAPP